MAKPMHILNCHIYIKDLSVTSFSVLSDGCQIAVGYSSGTIILFTGNFIRENSSQMRATSQSTQITLLPSHIFPVSALHFCEIIQSKTQQQNTVDRRIRLFAVMDTTSSSSSTNSTIPNSSSSEDPSRAGVLVFDTSITMYGTNNSSIGIATRKDVKVLDERGASSKASSFMQCTNELVIARADAVYSYSLDDRGGALAVAGDKLCISSGMILYI